MRYEVMKKYWHTPQEGEFSRNPGSALYPKMKDSKNEGHLASWNRLLKSMREGPYDESDPIIVEKIRGGKLQVIDGYHRILAGIELQKEVYIWQVRFESDDDKYRYVADKHEGRRSLSAYERVVAAIKRLRVMGRDVTHRALIDETGLSSYTVSKYSQVSKIPKLAKDIADQKIMPSQAVQQLEAKKRMKAPRTKVRRETLDVSKQFALKLDKVIDQRILAGQSPQSTKSEMINVYEILAGHKYVKESCARNDRTILEQLEVILNEYYAVEL